jgi:hypothetical protein
MSDNEEDEEGEGGMVTLQFSPTTITLLQRLADMGIFGIGIEGVCEGFVHRGLQVVTAEEGDES